MNNNRITMVRAKTNVATLLLALLLALTLSMPALAAADGPFGLTLSLSGDAASTMTASWRDADDGRQVMQVALETAYNASGFATVLEYAAIGQDVSLDGSGVWHYQATADGLSANTVYVYRVGSEGNWSEVRRFSTADPAETGLTFFYFGDIQVATDSEKEFTAWGELAQAAYARDPQAAFAIQGGDIVESGISVAQFDLFFANATSVFASIPLLATNGNHESNFPDSGKPELFMEYFALPENGPQGFVEEFFSFDYANCHIIALNSWIFSGEQKLTKDDYERVKAWLAADLAASDADWQIVVTHIPVYPVHSDTTATAVQENWAAFFERYGVDLVFEGHQHVYSRSYPMYGGRVDHEQGIVYIMGNSGQKFYDSADESFAARTVYHCANYQVVRIDGDTLSVQCLDAAGNELDYLSIAPRSLALSRGEYVEALWRGAGSPTVKTASPFADADAMAVRWAYENGLVNGYGNGRFGPNDGIAPWQADLIRGRLK